MSGNTQTPVDITRASTLFYRTGVTTTVVSRDNGTLPDVGPNPNPIQYTVHNHRIFLCYLMEQIRHSMDTKHVMRCVGAGVASIYSRKANIFGATRQMDEWDGMNTMQAMQDYDAMIPTNFPGEIELNAQDLMNLSTEYDIVELSFLFGILVFAGVKQPTATNLPAFNANRRKALQSVMISDPKIFVDNSDFLVVDILSKVNKAFNAHLPQRIALLDNIIGSFSSVAEGHVQAFNMAFALCAENGMTAFKIITEGLTRFPFLATLFPHMASDINAVQRAHTYILTREPNAKRRPFLKCIHGNAWTPVNLSEINSILGACKYVLRHKYPSYTNYGGGAISNTERDAIDRYMVEHGYIIEDKSDDTSVVDQAE